MGRAEKNSKARQKKISAKRGHGLPYNGANPTKNQGLI
jgi:hypothetical protein